MIFPMFFLFTVYGVVSAYLPIMLRGIGYSLSQVGILMGIFEVAGLVFPLAMGSLVEKKGNYGVPMLLLAFLLMIVPLPMISLKGFWVTSICLSLYAIGYKGSVPVVDSFTNRLLGENRNNYGKIRVAGSIGFVMTTLLLQFFGNSKSSTLFEYQLWFIIPGSLYTISIFFVPKVFKTDSKEVATKLEHHNVSTDNSKFSSRYWIGLMLIFLSFLGLTPATKLFSLYVTEFLNSNMAPALWALSAASEIPFMFFSGRFIKKFGSFGLIIFCTGTVVLRMILYILFPSIFGAILGQLLNSITYGLFHPAAVIFVTENAPSGKLMISMSMYSILAVGLANVLGNSFGGIMIDNFGYTVTFLSFAMLPFVGLIFYYFTRKKIC